MKLSNKVDIDKMQWVFCLVINKEKTSLALATTVPFRSTNYQIKIASIYMWN